MAERLLCLQAQDQWSGLASVAVRCRTDLGAVQAAFGRGDLVRTWALRGTLHVLAGADVTWLRELLAGRQLASAAGRAARLGLDPPTIARAGAVAGEALAAAPRTRAELLAAWTAAGIPVDGERGYQLIWHLAHLGTLLLGPMPAGRQLFVAGESRLPPSPGMDRDEALAALAHRYFVGHGPATAADLSRWAGLTLADARRGTAAARHRLGRLDVDGTAYLLGPATQDELAADRRRAQAVIALPPFDELLFGYRDRTPTLPRALEARVFPHRNGVPGRPILQGGEVVATWARAGAAIEVTPLVAVSAGACARAAAAAAALG